MPAKKEYLSSPGQRALKITAGVIGGYILSIAVHLVAGVLLPFRTEVIMTGAYSVFILWIAFMVLSFLARNGWVLWGIYLFGTFISATIIYLLR